MREYVLKADCHDQAASREHILAEMRFRVRGAQLLLGGTKTQPAAGSEVAPILNESRDAIAFLDGNGVGNGQLPSTLYPEFATQSFQKLVDRVRALSSSDAGSVLDRLSAIDAEVSARVEHGYVAADQDAKDTSQTVLSDRIEQLENAVIELERTP